MSIVQLEAWRPFDHIHDHLNERMNSAWWSNAASRIWRPALDVAETDTNYVITLDVPGVATDDINVTLEDGALTIKGSRKIEHTGADENEGNFRSFERISGSFSRTVKLPDKALGENVAALAKDGVLTITVDKKDAILPKRIEVQG
ncbi:MAG: Hsp20/alpha crystallin family protein [Gammaproteobacteria bacterium]|nr:Hsp20/alpha crystallin family protein [Gammaproteobacteria bacterium]